MAIEAGLRQQHASLKTRQIIRGQESRPIVARIHRALVTLKLGRRHLPQSLIGRAIDYTLGLWPTLQEYLIDGRLEIDNNLVENAIRPTALGKKNWLFIGEAEAGDRGAILYTIIECCRRRALDPYSYLRDVLSRLPDMTNRQVPQMTPAAWAKATSQTTPLQVAS